LPVPVKPGLQAHTGVLPELVVQVASGLQPPLLTAQGPAFGQVGGGPSIMIHNSCPPLLPPHPRASSGASLDAARRVACDHPVTCEGCAGEAVAAEPGIAGACSAARRVHTTGIGAAHPVLGGADVDTCMPLSGVGSGAPGRAQEGGRPLIACAGGFPIVLGVAFRRLPGHPPSLCRMDRPMLPLFIKAIT